MNAMTQTRPLPPAQQVRQQLEAMAPQFALGRPAMTVIVQWASRPANDHHANDSTPNKQREA